MKRSTVKEVIPEPCTLCALKCYQHKIRARIPLQLVRNIEPGVLNKRMMTTVIDLCVSQQLKILEMGPMPSQN